jgi:hypothetical protein
LRLRPVKAQWAKAARVALIDTIKTSARPSMSRSSHHADQHYCAQGRKGADTATARRRRVNSLRRMCHAAAIGCHSIDGTYLAFGPTRNLPKLLRWLSLTDPTTNPVGVDP